MNPETKTPPAPAPVAEPEEPKYWAALSGFRLAEEAEKRARKYFTEIRQTVMYARWTKAYRTVYGLAGDKDPFDVARAYSTGEKDELTAIKVNHAGSLLQRTVALVSQTVPEFEPVPVNTDYKSLAQVDFAKNLLHYYMDSKGIGAGLYDTALAAGIFGIAWFCPEWDPRAGSKLTAPDPALPSRTKTGDLTFRLFDPLDVAVNRFRYDQDHDWYITRRWVNRYDLAARYPGAPTEDGKATLGEQIVDFKPPNLGADVPTNSIEAEKQHGKSEDADELVPLYTLYHKRTDALSEGRIAAFLSADILLYEGGLPYRDIPLIPVCPSKFLRTVNGNSALHHVLGLQDVYDNVASSLATNNVAFGTQIVMVPDEADYSIDEVSAGLSVLRYNSGVDGKQEPKGLNLTAPSAEALRFLEMAQSMMELLCGINGTLRGAPQANVQSGAFGALLAQQALEYSGAFQYSFQRAVEKTGNMIVQILKQYASEPIVAEIAGKSKAYELRSFTSEDLSQIDRILVKSGNPAARTAQFAIAAADALLAKGLISKKEYLTLVRTGQLEVAVDRAEAQAMNMRRENELIRAGKNPPVIVTDQHREHIESHGDEIGDPGTREDPKAVMAGLEHIKAHINALRQTDPALLMLLKQTPLPPVPGGTPLPTGTPPAPENPGAQGTQPGPDPTPPDPGGQLPEQPQLPNNPMTGEQWTPADGSIPQ